MTYQQALKDLKAGKFEAAIATLQGLLQADPAQPRLWLAKALAHLEQGDCQQATTVAEQALRLNPCLAPAHRVLGRAYDQLGQPQPAIAAYKQAVRCYLNQKNKPEAQSCIVKIEQLRTRQLLDQSDQSDQSDQPESVSSPSLDSQQLLATATANLEQGRYPVALEDLNWLLQLDSNNAHALAGRALAWANCHDPQSAARDMARALQLAPNDLDIRQQRGQMRLLLGDLEGAIADASAIIQQQPDTLQAYLLRSEAYYQLNQFDEAFKDISNALALDPEQVKGYELRAAICAAADDTKDALSNYRKAASLYLERGNWLAHQTLQPKIQALSAQLKSDAEEASRVIHIPIKFLRGGAPVVDVTFNGNVAFEMVFATGTGVTLLTTQMANLLNVIPTGTRHFRMLDDRVIPVPAGQVSSVSLGQAKADALEVCIAPAEYREGVIGQNFLWRYDVRISRTEIELHPR